MRQSILLILFMAPLMISFAKHSRAQGLSENCILPYKSNVPNYWAATCITAEAGSHWRQNLTTSIDNLETPLSHNGAQLNYYQLYLARHFNPHFSFHVQSRYHKQAWSRDLHYISQPDEETSYFLQLGHTTLDPITYTLGRFRQPFGIDLRLTPNYLLETYNKFWPQARPGASLTVNPNTVTSYEFGITIEEDQNIADTPFTFRINTTIPSLNGTKIAGSIMKGWGGKQSYSLGLINNDINYISSFEWVRVTSDTAGELPQQIIRLNYRQGWQDDQRWTIEFENFKYNGLLLTYSKDYLFYKYLILQISGSYQTAGLERNAPRFLFGSGIKCEI